MTEHWEGEQEIEGGKGGPLALQMRCWGLLFRRQHKGDCTQHSCKERALRAGRRREIRPVGEDGGELRDCEIDSWDRLRDDGPGAREKSVIDHFLSRDAPASGRNRERLIDETWRKKERGRIPIPRSKTSGIPPIEHREHLREGGRGVIPEEESD
jgi:hypothetical protein